MKKTINKSSGTRSKKQSMDHIKMQIMWTRLMGVVEGQAKSLIRTAFSATVSEAGDLSAAIFDRRGNMIAQAVTGTPGHVNSLAEAVKNFVKKFPVSVMAKGDHFITNDPWLSSGHLHDITVVTPTFRHGKLIALFACCCHQVDIGGLGQGPDRHPSQLEGPASDPERYRNLFRRDQNAPFQREAGNHGLQREGQRIGRFR